MNRRFLSLVFIYQILVLVSGCDHELDKFSDIYCSVTVSYNPYQSVNWQTWKPCLSQHHDHTKAIESRLRAYDQAGYHAVPLFDYSGVKSLPYAHRQRLWPLSRILPQYENDEAFIKTDKNIKFFIPAMEEVGLEHMTSPFLTHYIELWEPNLDLQKLPWQYATNQELIDLINRFGGMAVIAHPTKRFELYRNLENFSGIEIYNAFYNYSFRTGKFAEDTNEHFLVVWDDLLAHKSSKIFGYAVNDWHGPDNFELRNSYPDIYDSGKTLVMLEAYTLENYRKSLENGAFLAIKDLGVIKNMTPEIIQIEVDSLSINIRAKNGAVKWMFWGDVIQHGARLDLSYQPHNVNYVRAEVVNEHGVVYVQPFSLREVAHNVEPPQE